MSDSGTREGLVLNNNLDEKQNRTREQRQYNNVSPSGLRAEQDKNKNEVVDRYV